MIKNLKKLFSMGICSLMIFSSVGLSHADTVTDFSPEPRSAISYQGSFGYGIYVGGGDGITFKNAEDPYYKASQWAAVSGKPVGVIYRILRTDGSTARARQLSHPQKDYKVSFSYIGNCKAYMRNVYNSDNVQKVSGSFHY